MDVDVDASGPDELVVGATLVLVLVLLVVTALEDVLGAGWAGISTRLSAPPCRTLAAAAVTPPTISAAATPTAASLRECFVMGTGAIPS